VLTQKGLYLVTSVLVLIPSALLGSAIILPQQIGHAAQWVLILAGLTGCLVTHLWTGNKWAAIIGGGVGSGLFFGLFGFLATLFIPPDPGTRYMWGQGIDAAILTGALGTFFGAGFGCVGGFFYAMIAAIVTECIREHRHRDTCAAHSGER
jgi:hypothetical protein